MSMAIDGVDHYFGSFKAAAGHADMLDSVLQSDSYFYVADLPDFPHDPDTPSKYTAAGFDAYAFDHASHELPAGSVSETVAPGTESALEAPLTETMEGHAGSLADCPAQSNAADPTVVPTAAVAAVLPTRAPAGRGGRGSTAAKRAHAKLESPDPDTTASRPSPPSGRGSSPGAPSKTATSPTGSSTGRSAHTAASQANKRRTSSVSSPPSSWPSSAPSDAACEPMVKPETIQPPLFQQYQQSAANPFLLGSVAHMALGWPQALLAASMFPGSLVLPRPPVVRNDNSPDQRGKHAGKVPIQRIPHASPSLTPPVETPAAQKDAKRSAHSVIERRYRENLNDRLTELRDECLAGFPKEAETEAVDTSLRSRKSATSMDKGPQVSIMNKSKVLHRATVYIRYLKAAQATLTKQNEELVKLVKSLGGEERLAAIDALKLANASAFSAATELMDVAAQPSSNSSEDADDSSEDSLDLTDSPAGTSLTTATPPTDSPASTTVVSATPPSEDLDSPASAAAAAAEPPEKKRAKFTPPANLTESGRVLMAACLGLCLLTLPFSSSPGLTALWSEPRSDGDFSAATFTGRSLQSDTLFTGAASSGAQRTIEAVLAGPAFALLGRALVALAALLLLLFGEPVVHADSVEYHKADAALGQAESALAHGDASTAQSISEKALEALRRPAPVTAFDLALGLLWQSLRQISHALLIGWWLDRRVTQRRFHARTTFRLAASLHDVHQRALAVSLEGVYSQSSLHRAQAVYSALSSINLAEAADMPQANLAKIYAVAAMNLRLVLPGVMRPVAWFYLKRARWCLAMGSGQSSPSASRRDVFSKDTTTSSSLQHMNGLTWLRQPEAYDFFAGAAWARRLWACRLTHAHAASADPVARFAALFREEQLAQVFTAILEHAVPDPLLRRLATLVDEARVAGDVVAEWWATVGEALLREQLNHREQADSKWTRLQSLARLHPLIDSNDYCHMLLLSVMARDAALAGHAEVAMRAADRAAALLAVAVPAGACAPMSTLNPAAEADDARADSEQRAPSPTDGDDSDSAADGVDSGRSMKKSAPEDLWRLTPARAITAVLAAELVVEARLAVGALLRTQPGYQEAHLLKVLSSARSDLAVLRHLATTVPSNQPQAAYHRLRACFRGLAGGAISRTMVMIETALRIAQASALLHEQGTIRTSMAWLLCRSPAEAQKQLQMALYCYEQVDALRDVQAVKRLLLHP